MSINTAHISKGVLIHAGEPILLHSKNVAIEFPGQLSQLFSGLKPGYVYLTSHRMIFRSKRQVEALQSLSIPFIAIDDISVDKESSSIPNSNSMRGKLRAQANGNFEGQIEFKLFFKSNEAAVQFADALFCAISMTVRSDINRDLLPPYQPPRVWYEASWGAYKCPTVFKKWLPTNEIFTNPSPNSVFMCDNHPPFPGIDSTNSGFIGGILVFYLFDGNFPTHIEPKLHSLDSGSKPWTNSKFPTPTESCDGFIHPPIYGYSVVKCTNMEACVFPHQATTSLSVQRNSEAKIKS